MVRSNYTVLQLSVYPAYMQRVSLGPWPKADSNAIRTGQYPSHVYNKTKLASNFFEKIAFYDWEMPVAFVF